jgi:hypothetical protein
LTSQGSTGLNGAHVALTLIDPWDVVSDLGAGPFKAVVLDVDLKEQVAILELQSALPYRSVKYKHFIVRTRHEGVDLQSLAAGDTITCNLTAVVSGHLGSGDSVLALRSWRSGLGLIGDIRLV